MSKQPSVEDFVTLFDDIGSAVSRARNEMPKYFGTNLLSRRAATWRDFEPEGRLAAQAAAESAVADDPTLQWLRKQHDFTRLVTSLHRKARAEPNSEFAGPFAELLITQCVCMGKLKHVALIGLGQQPRVMSKDDWDAAIDAAQTLKRLQDENGLQLWRAITSNSEAITTDWPDTLLSKLRLSKDFAKKPSPDEFASDRAAVRTFVDWLLIFFGDAPEPLVAKFAELIGYRPDTIGYHLPYWIDCYKRGVLI